MADKRQIRSSILALVASAVTIFAPPSFAVDLAYSEDTFLIDGNFTFDDVYVTNCCTGPESANLFIIRSTVDIGVLIQSHAIFMVDSSVSVDVLEITGGSRSQVPGGLYLYDGGELRVLGGARRGQTIENSITLDRGGLSVVYVDFNYFGPEDGSQSFPFNSYAEAAAVVAVGGTISISTGHSAETMDVTFPHGIIVTQSDQAMQQVAVLGSTLIGVGSGLVEIEVYDGVTQLPITTADVSMRLYGSGERIVASHSGTGTYFAFGDAGIYDVVVVAPDHEVADKNVVVHSLGYSSASFLLEPLSEGSTILASIPIPSSSAVVFTNRIDVFQSGTSNLVASTSEVEGSSFRVSNLSAGSYDLQAASFNYTIGSGTVSVGTEETKSVELSSSIISSPATIAGTVDDTDAMTPGLEGAKVFASIAILSLTFDTTSATGGAYFFPDIGLTQTDTSVRVQAQTQDGTKSSDPVIILLDPGEDKTGVILQIDLTDQGDSALLLREQFLAADDSLPEGLLDEAEANAQVGLTHSEFLALDSLTVDGYIDMEELLAATVGPPGIVDTVFVDVNYSGPELEIGNRERPFNSLREASNFVKSPLGEIKVTSAPIAEKVTISRPMTILLKD